MYLLYGLVTLTNEDHFKISVLYRVMFNKGNIYSAVVSGNLIYSAESRNYNNWTQERLKGYTQRERKREREVIALATVRDFISSNSRRLPLFHCCVLFCTRCV